MRCLARKQAQVALYVIRLLVVSLVMNAPRTLQLTADHVFGYQPMLKHVTPQARRRVIRAKLVQVAPVLHEPTRTSIRGSLDRAQKSA